MDEEDKALLEETAKLAKSNNKILKGMQRTARWSFALHSIKWIIIAVITLWSFTLIQPYLVKIAEIYTGVKSAQESVGNIQNKINLDANQFSDLLKSFGGGD